jgi:tripartite-type tricarboxylate transporter receptor subunit TctC
MPLALPRRAALAAPFLALALPARAQDFPARPIRMIIPYPPGGASDVIARLLGPHMTEVLGQPIVAENRPGGNGSVAAEFVARSAPDGYTLLMGNAGPNALNQALYGTRMTYDSVRDFSPISMVSVVPMLLAAHPSLPAKDLREVIALAKAQPGQVNYGHGGVGSAPHLTMEQLADIGGFQWTAVPFRGGQLAIAAVLGNQIPLLMDTSVTLVPQVKEGKLRGIAVTTLTRVPQVPDVPTIAEQGFPGFEATSWGGIVGPANLPAPIVQRLHAAILHAMAKPEVKATLEARGVQGRTSTPAEFTDFVRAELARWSAVVAKSGIKPE